MQIVDLEQKSQKWLDWREKRITASETPTILGLNPDMTPYQLWGQKLEVFARPDLSRNPYVRMGVEMEDPVRCRIEDSEEIKALIAPYVHEELLLIPVCAEGTKSSHKHLGASYDGLHLLSDIKGFPAEIKYPSEKTWLDVSLFGVNSKAFRMYEAQVHHQMLLCDADAGLLVFGQLEDSLSAEISLRPFLIERSKEWDERIISETKAFHELILSRRPPKVDLKRDVYYPQGEDLKIWEEEAKEIRMLQEEIDSFKEKQARLEGLKAKHRDVLVGHMNGHKTASFEGVSITRSIRQGSVDYAAIFEHKKIDITEDEFNSHRRSSTEVIQVRVSDKKQPEFPMPLTMAHQLVSQEATDKSDWF
jgi:putative phage-type endonuclease